MRNQHQQRHGLRAKALRNPVPLKHEIIRIPLLTQFRLQSAENACPFIMIGSARKKIENEFRIVS